MFYHETAHSIKNLFIFIPLVFGKKLFVYPINIEVIATFLLFSMVSGVVYLVNDILNAERDKLHPTKRLRPIASGKLKVESAWVAALILGIISISFSFLLNMDFGLTVTAYIIFNFLYSKILADAVIVDVFCIGVFFLLRITAGSVVSGVNMSYCIIFMTMLLALFLGFNKRRHELTGLGRIVGHHRLVLTQYSAYFIDQMISVITSSIVVAYMLYTVDRNTVQTFGTDHLIYTIPFVYYGIFRYLYFIHKIRKEGDPTRILLADNRMQLNLALWVTVSIVVIYFKA